MDLDLATIASSGNIEIAGLTVVAWFLKSLIGVATKTYSAFVKIEQQGENIAAQQKDAIAEQKKTNELLTQLIQSNKDIIDSNHEISNILLYNIPPRKVVEKTPTNA